MATLAELRTLLAVELSAVTGQTIHPAPPLIDAIPGTGVIYATGTAPGQRFGTRGRATLQAAIVTGTDHDEAAAEACVDAWSGLLLGALLGGLDEPNTLSEHAPGGALIESAQLALSADGSALYALIATVSLDVDLI